MSTVSGDDAGAAGGDEGRRPRTAWALVLALVVGLYAAGVALGGGREALATVREASLLPLAGALAAQLAVMATWPLVHAASLRVVDGRLPYRWALNVSMTAFTVSHTVPGGGAVGAAAVVERLTGFGVPGPVAAASVSLTGPVSLTTIVALGVLGLAAAVLAGELPGAWLLLGLVALVALLAALGLIVGGLRSPVLGERVIGVLGRVHSGLGAHAEGWRDAWRGVTRQEVGARQLGPVVGWSTAKWAADIASLALVFVAYGQGPRLTVLLVGFCASQLGAAVPLTPGGVGFVEGGMIAVFAALGVALPVATSVVITYRVLETWLPTLAGTPMLLRPPAPGEGPARGPGRRAQ